MSQPLHARVADELRGQILHGERPPGTPLPSEARLCAARRRRGRGVVRSRGRVAVVVRRRHLGAPGTVLLYRFDVNVRSSLVLGLVGAGGIGFLINQSIALFRFDEMMTYILMVLVLIVAVDILSVRIRRLLAT